MICCSFLLFVLLVVPCHVFELMLRKFVLQKSFLYCIHTCMSSKILCCHQKQVKAPFKVKLSTYYKFAVCCQGVLKAEFVRMAGKKISYGFHPFQLRDPSEQIPCAFSIPWQQIVNHTWKWKILSFKSQKLAFFAIYVV